ncbi:MAG: hypothetical protein PVG11_09455 [Anaerolineae bacterium]|jgi:hypothetical protein
MILDTRRRICFSLLGWLLLTALSPAAASAHVGAPYPVLLEEPIGPYTLSALADPDVGGGTFYVLLEHQGASAPAGTTVTLWAEPADGHLASAAYTAVREETRYGERFVGEVPFDTEGAWRMRVVVDGPAGTGEATFPVEVTPPGTGWIATVACLLPFVLLAALWLRGISRRRSISVP